MLGRHELRQLAQRVTARYHLSALSRQETEDYIRHRLAVAGGDGKASFTADALTAVHRYSEGIPRLINLVCDRALLAGYVAGERQIDGAMVRRAAGEVLAARPSHPRRRQAALAAGVAVVAFMPVVLWRALPAAPAGRAGSRGRFSGDRAGHGGSAPPATAPPIAPFRRRRRPAGGRRHAGADPPRPAPRGLHAGRGHAHPDPVGDARPGAHHAAHAHGPGAPPRPAGGARDVPPRARATPATWPSSTWRATKRSWPSGTSRPLRVRAGRGRPPLDAPGRVPVAGLRRPGRRRRPRADGSLGPRPPRAPRVPAGRGPPAPRSRVSSATPTSPPTAASGRARS